MKQRKKFICITIVMAMLILCLSGCGVTKEKLLAKIGVNMLAAKSFTMNAVMDINMTGDVLGASIDANVNMNMDTDINVKPFVGYGKGEVTTKVLGQSSKVNMELYEESVDGQLNVYASVDGSDWQKHSSELDDDNGFKLYGLAGIAKVNDMLELEKETSMIDDIECYQIKGAIDGETLEGIIDTTMGSEGQVKELLKNVDWSGRQVPTQIYVDKKGEHLVKMSFDMIGVIDAAFDEALGEFSGLLKSDKCTLDISFSNYNKVEQIVIPDEVRNNAKEG